jgi:hypothetical protein
MLHIHKNQPLSRQPGGLPYQTAPVVMGTNVRHLMRRQGGTSLLVPYTLCPINLSALALGERVVPPRGTG